MKQNKFNRSHYKKEISNILCDKTITKNAQIEMILELIEGEHKAKEHFRKQVLQLILK